MYSKMMLPIELTKILYSHWQGQISVSSQDSQIYGKCLNGPGSVTFKNGNKYEGNFYNGLLSGVGKFTWVNGIVYEGEFTDNRITGKGIYRWPDGSVYQGYVKDGLRHGHGKLTLDDATYEGQWFEGKKNGKGKIQFKSGSIFQGNFVNDMKHGFGKMYYYPSGNYFEGYWSKDLKEGKGTMNWIDIRQKYVGDWHENLQHGIGMHIWLESKGEGKYLRNRYEGGWSKGARDGFGVFYYANGSKYEGYWKNNMKEGNAFYTNQNGVIELIMFEKDRMMKPQQRANDDKKGTKKDIVEPNPYAISLRVQDYYQPSSPNLEQLYNLLLRSNTQLKNWYKGVSTFFDQHSELSFCLNLQGAWKIIRGLKMLGDFTLANFNRGLYDINVNIPKLLPIATKPSKPIQYESLYYQILSNYVADIDWDDKQLKVQSTQIPMPLQQYYVHNKDRNLLFRQFIQLLVWMSHNLDPNYKNPKQSMEKLLQKITPYLQSLCKIVKTGSNDNVSENISTVSKTQKSITPYFRNINSQLLKIIRTKQSQRLLRNDLTIRLKELLGLGMQSKVFQDNQLLLLQRILQKYMDPQVLSRPKSSNWSNSRISPKILNLINYQFIQFQFIELLFFLLIKKLPNHKQTEENKSKYQKFIDLLKEAHQSSNQKLKVKKQFQNEVRYLQSDKLLKKAKLQEKRKIMQQEKKKRQLKQFEVMRQAIELQQMQREDINIKQQQLEQQQSQLDI